jgi:uncharacterized damage-inducible protein DinB
METLEPLDTSWNAALWQQFGAAIDMFDNAVVACPDSLWRERLWSAPPDDPQSPRGEVWRIAYHTLYWLDLYLSSILSSLAAAKGVPPPAPFPAPSLDAEDDEPEQPYTKEELRAYLVYTRQKCQDTIATLIGERAHYPYEFPWEKGQGRPISYLELMLYAMRHTQEHAAQLSLFLGAHGIPDANLDWVSRAQGEG